MPSNTGASSHVNCDCEFDPEAIRLPLTKLVIIDKEPFSMDEQQGFREFCSVVVPRFNVPSRFTVARDCKKIFVCEKRIIKRQIKGFNIKNSHYYGLLDFYSKFELSLFDWSFY